jgi:hypothetical protein
VLLAGGVWSRSVRGSSAMPETISPGWPSSSPGWCSSASLWGRRGYCP